MQLAREGGFEGGMDRGSMIRRIKIKSEQKAECERQVNRKILGDSHQKNEDFARKRVEKKTILI